MVNFSTESQRRSINQSMALLAHVFATLRGLDTSIALMAQSAVLVSYKTRITQLLRAQLATEAIWMPRRIHRLDHPSNHDVSTLVAIRCKESAKITLTVLSSLKLVKHSIRKSSEALGTPKTILDKYIIYFQF